MKTIVSVIAMAALITTAPAVFAASKQKPEGKAEERKNGSIIAGDFDYSKKCAAGKHFASVDIKARHKDAICVVNIIDTNMKSCTTQANDWSFESLNDDAVARLGDDETPLLNPHVALCDALQKATMAINADPEALAAIQAKVNVQDLHFVHDMLVSNGVPAEMLGDSVDDAKDDDARVKVHFHWDIVSGETRNMQRAQPKPLQMRVDWDQKTNIKVLM
jgi:hypothetical protein